MIRVGEWLVDRRMIVMRSKAETGLLPGFEDLAEEHRRAKEAEFYATLEGWPVRGLVEAADPPLRFDHVVEHAAGDGHLVRHVVACAPQAKRWTLVELRQEATDRAARVARDLGLSALVHTGDFLKGAGGDLSAASLLITNPAFSIAAEYLAESVRRAPRADVALLVRQAFFSSAERAQLLQDLPLDRYDLRERPSFNGDGTDLYDYTWAVAGPGRGGRWYTIGRDPAPLVRCGACGRDVRGACGALLEGGERCKLPRGHRALLVAVWFPGAGHSVCCGECVDAAAADPGSLERQAIEDEQGEAVAKGEHGEAPRAGLEIKARMGGAQEAAREGADREARRDDGGVQEMGALAAAQEASAEASASGEASGASGARGGASGGDGIGACAAGDGVAVAAERCTVRVNGSSSFPVVVGAVVVDVRGRGVVVLAMSAADVCGVRLENEAAFPVVVRSLCCVPDSGADECVWCAATRVEAARAEERGAECLALEMLRDELELEERRTGGIKWAPCDLAGLASQPQNEGGRVGNGEPWSPSPTRRSGEPQAEIGERSHAWDSEKEGCNSSHKHGGDCDSRSHGTAVGRDAVARSGNEAPLDRGAKEREGGEPDAGRASDRTTGAERVTVGDGTKGEKEGKPPTQDGAEGAPKSRRRKRPASRTKQPGESTKMRRSKVTETSTSKDNPGANVSPVVSNVDCSSPPTEHGGNSQNKKPWDQRGTAKPEATSSGSSGEPAQVNGPRFASTLGGLLGSVGASDEAVLGPLGPLELELVGSSGKVDGGAS